ncbi:MAG: NAD(+)/NADH kinase [Nitrososphaerales archaeon]
MSKEGQGEAKEVAKEIANILLGKGFSVTSSPNLRMKGVGHVRHVRDIAKSKTDLVITVSGDGTILRLLRVLDSNLPCLCVNVGGRGILAEIKPDQISGALDKIEKGDFIIEKRLRVSPSLEGKILPPALNEVFLIRQAMSRTPMFTIELNYGARFSQRMDGLLITTATGSTGHSYSYGSPFVEGSLQIFELTPLAPLNRFPPIICSPKVRVSGDQALHLVIDGQDTFNVELGMNVSFRKHSKEASFVRFDKSGPYRQLLNLGFS